MKIFILSLLAAHFIGDWLLQSRKMATTKFKELPVLLNHLYIVHAMLGLALIVGVMTHQFVVVNVGTVFALLLTNFISHGIIDENIWWIYGKIRGNNAYEPMERKVTILEAEPTKATFIEENPVDKTKVKHDYGFYSTIAIDQFLHLSILFLLFLT